MSIKRFRIVLDGEVHEVEVEEVKAGGAMPLWLSEFLSGEGLFKVHFSKVGVAYKRMLERQGLLRGVPDLRKARSRDLAPAYLPVPSSSIAFA